VGVSASPKLSPTAHLARPHPHTRITAYLEDKVAAVQETDAALAAEWDTVRDLYTRKCVSTRSRKTTDFSTPARSSLGRGAWAWDAYANTANTRR